MEALWESEIFTADDFRVFKYQADPDTGVADNRPECRAFHTNTTLLEIDFDKWLPETGNRNTKDFERWLNTASPTTKTEDYFALMLLPVPRHETRFPDLVNSAILKKLPISKESLKVIATGLKLHHAFAVILDRGVPTISRNKFESNGKSRFVYTLRVEHTLQKQSAMTITHFREAAPIPGSGSPSNTGAAGGTQSPHQSPISKTYALILGYNDSDIPNGLKRCLQNCKESIFNPFTLIKAFLSVELDYRFREVDRRIADFQDILQNYGRPPFGTNGAGRPNNDRRGNEQDPNNLIGLYLEIYMVKIRLTSWSRQIAGLKKYADDFLFPGTVQPDFEPEEYLQCMVNEYEVKINKCEMVLQGASLAFQMETAHLAREDSKRSIEIAGYARADSKRSVELAEYARADSIHSIQIAELSRLDSLNAMRDGKQMKAIALLTMIFLPGTFIATLLAVPVFDGMKQTTRFKPWAWYPILFVPLTMVVLATYFAWITYYKTESQKEVDKYKIYKPFGLETISLATPANP